MADGQTELRVPLSWTGENGVVYTKTFIFKRGEFASAAGDAATSGVPASGQGKTITVKTDVLSLNINTRGGDIEQAQLLTYPDKLGSDAPFQLLETTPAFV
ncbi:hypothetical protein CRX72_00775 [Pantoea sp. BRM17]|nr:hypothetical protein CRX72_00775 [Pantoea sp. BRM17]